MAATRVHRSERDWLDERHVDSPLSFIGWKVEQESTYVSATLTLADCSRRVEIEFNNVSDLGKLDIIREHLDLLERAARRAFKQLKEEGEKT